MDILQKEKLETLDGSRAKTTAAKRRQAVRVADLAPILEVADRLQSAQVSGSPTQAEHNALQADVAALHRRLAALSDAIAAKLR